ncbi:hypothetical protein HII36_10830 [Nonomuraea sp. NN258]|uniref:hypothetical protein n=1 Tax=Nonomuraea antri TaxID=2730852 RepID=UPI0015688CA4|nr:hypothetical protein [Nonomuraea antri]NRQ32329.1 hypothetical protein [Nonomuraea antri]
MGLARLALAVLAAVAVVSLLVVGGRALLSSLDTPDPPPERLRVSAAASPSASKVPTVRIECVADTCPHVTVRVPGGDVLQHREMSKGEEVRYFKPELDVVLSDAGTVRVAVNGEPRPQGESGEREAFTAKSPK